MGRATLLVVETTSSISSMRALVLASERARPAELVRAGGLTTRARVDAATLAWRREYVTPPSEASDLLRQALVVLDESKRVAAARGELLRVMLRRATLESAGLVLADGKPAPIVPVGPSRDGVVVVQTRLAEEHPAPWWIVPARLAILAGMVPLLEAQGVVLVALLLAVWVVSGWVVRYRVVLPPGRALRKGGRGSTRVPGTYWLRRRWSARACSIPTHPLHVDWRPAPTRLEQGEHQAWLELEAQLWVEPCADEPGQRRALLSYERWHEHATAASVGLRNAVLEAVVEHIGANGLLLRVAGPAVRLDDDADVRLAIARGLRELGLELRHMGPCRIALVSRAESLETHDRLWLDTRPPPSP